MITGTVMLVRPETTRDVAMPDETDADVLNLPKTIKIYACSESLPYQSRAARWRLSYPLELNCNWCRLGLKERL